jgi:hypothetical protein
MIGINADPPDGLLLPPRRRAYQNQRAQSPADENSSMGPIDRVALGKMMASDDKKVKTGPAPKGEAAPEKKSVSPAEPSKAEVGQVAAALPSAYSRGEGQKPVSKAYRDNWNVIFAKKKKR